MTREQAKNILPIVQAYAKGKTIEFRAHDTTCWDGESRFLPHENGCCFDVGKYEYRIKPEPPKPREFFIRICPKAKDKISIDQRRDESSCCPGCEQILVREVLK